MLLLPCIPPVVLEPDVRLYSPRMLHPSLPPTPENPPMGSSPNRPVRIATWSEIEDRTPAYALVEGVDLVIVR